MKDKGYCYLYDNVIRNNFMKSRLFEEVRENFNFGECTLVYGQSDVTSNLSYFLWENS